jgi:uncharacterized protein
VLNRTYALGRVFMEGLPHKKDLLSALQEFCSKRQLESGSLSVIGAASKGAFAYYDQKRKRYETRHCEEGLEIVSCLGNISIFEGRPFVHAHILFAKADGQTLGGHLVEGTLLFAGELFLQEWIGPERIRQWDSRTGLNLWKHRS